MYLRKARKGTLLVNEGKSLYFVEPFTVGCRKYLQHVGTVLETEQVFCVTETLEGRSSIPAVGLCFSVDQITIKTPNRLHLCLIEFIDWRYSQSGGGVFSTPLVNYRGLGQINTCRQVPLQVSFSEKPKFRVWCLYSYL
jgi:hypothetical protein